MAVSTPGIPGGKIGIRDVAERAQVAISSVSRVLSGGPNVSDQMRQRVMQAVEELGFTPDPLAQSMRTGLTKVVGLVIPDVRNSMMIEIIHVVEATLQEAGYSLMLLSSLGSPALEVDRLCNLLNRRVDGVILSLVDESNVTTWETVNAAPCPVVLIDREQPDPRSCPYVYFEHAQGLTQGITRLIELGHRHIGMVVEPPTVRPPRERALVLKRQCETAGIACTILVEEEGPVQGAKATHQLLDLDDPPTAIISTHNQFLVGVLGALSERGVTVPTDVSLISCDEVPMAPFLSPRLAVIRRDATAMGAAVTDQVLKAISGESPARLVLPTHFIDAESCAAPPH